MKNKLIILLFVVQVSFSYSQQKYTDLVDPFIGTGGHGHTFPGATLPFGMVQLSPDTDTQGWDWCSGYHASDNSIMGFSHTHLSGTGGADYGDIMILPFIGETKLNPGPKNEPDKGYRSCFEHANEVAEPGYYSVELIDNNITAELTATSRVGFHRYTFLNSDSGRVLLDLHHGISDIVRESHIQVVDEHEVIGLRRSKGWASDQRVYFVMQFSEPIKLFKLFSNDVHINSERVEGTNTKAVFDFNTQKANPLLIKVAISAVDEDGCRKNLNEELPHWDFDKIRSDADQIWNKYLSKIEVEGDSKEQQTIFYTALYHTMIHPNIFMDVDGRYRGIDKVIHKAEGFDHYTLFSLWDTFRAIHPLYNLIFPELNNHFIKSMLVKYDEHGLLPVWELFGNETGTMIGYHSIPVIVDAYMKGYRDFDVEKAFTAMKKSAKQDHLGLKYLKTAYFIPMDKEGNSVSKALEYAYDDWCIAQFAKALGKVADYKYFIDRATFYRNHFDSQSGMMRGRSLSGKWRENFDPANASGWGSGDFTEGNSWQYTWSVQQDITGLIELMGGDEDFFNKLDRLFTTQYDKEHAPSDMTGLIGQYAHGNEPSHHIGYLYNFAGKPWKTQQTIRQILTDMYTVKRDGLCGNEDCGQMSAWYVFSSMGFYPVTPGLNDYVIGSPLFNKVKINLPNGKKFEINAENNNDSNVFIQNVFVNGQPYQKSFLTFGQIMEGANLEFIMGESPNRNWANEPKNRPVVKIEEKYIPAEERKVFQPILKGDTANLFNKKRDVELNCINPNAKIYYTIDGSAPDQNSNQYSDPIIINKPLILKAIAFSENLLPSEILEHHFQKAIYRNDASAKYPRIHLQNPQHHNYASEGANSLMDGKFGTELVWGEHWLGFEVDDMIADIDLGDQFIVDKINVRFLRDQGGWIFLPKYVEFFISNDGIDFRSIQKITHNETFPDAPRQVLPISVDGLNEKIRFIKVIAKNIEQCPDWHGGNKAFLFCDEILIQTKY